MDKPKDNSEKEYDDKILHAFDNNQKKEEAVETLLSKEEKEKIVEKQKELKSLPEEFDVKHISDLAYLSEIFSAKYDRFKSLDFLQKTRNNMLQDGYPDCATLNEFLFWVTMSRRLQINYQRIHAKLINKEGVAAEEAENIGMLKEMRNISEEVGSLQKALDALREKRQQIKDVVDLHAATMKDAEEFIRTHIGEFTFKCIAKGTKILMADLSTKKIEDIEVGNSLMTFEEKPIKRRRQERFRITKVIGKHYSGKKDVIKISTGDNELILTSDHKLLSYKKNSHDKRWETIERILKTNRRIKVLDSILIKNIGEYLKGTLLGLIDSDGQYCIPKQKNTQPYYMLKQKIEVKYIRLLMDKLHIKYVEKQNRVFSTFSRRQKSTPFSVIEIGNWVRLSSFYIRKPEIDKIKFWFSNLLKKESKDMQYGYLAGIVLGDGCITKVGRILIFQARLRRSGKKNQALLRLQKILKQRKIHHGEYIKCKHRSDRQDIFRFQFMALSFPFHAPGSVKFTKYITALLNDVTVETAKSKIPKKIKMKIKKEEVFDLTTQHGTFIANGILVHNCSKCNSIVDSRGLPHFAIMTEKDDQNGEIVYHTFSKELWYLYQKKLIPLSYVAFILRTSPEGFLITAQKRGEWGSQPALEDVDAIEQEENELKKLHKDFETREKE